VAGGHLIEDGPGVYAPRKSRPAAQSQSQTGIWVDGAISPFRPAGSPDLQLCAAAEPNSNKDAGHDACPEHLRSVDQDINPADGQFTAEPAGGCAQRNPKTPDQERFQPYRSDGVGGKADDNSGENREYLVHKDLPIQPMFGE